MSVANAFYVTVTIDEVEPQRYVEVASALATAMQTITSTKLAEFTKPHLTKPRCEVEVGVASVEGSTYTVQADIWKWFTTSALSLSTFGSWTNLSR